MMEGERRNLLSVTNSIRFFFDAVDTLLPFSLPSLLIEEFSKRKDRSLRRGGRSGRQTSPETKVDNGARGEARANKRH